MTNFIFVSKRPKKHPRCLLADVIKSVT